VKRPVKLTKKEKEIEKYLLRGEFVDVNTRELENIADAIKARKKDKVLNVRINSQDLKRLKQKAHELGVKYQSFVSELLHRFVHL
jgi:predicted DNA binding CopG/RHH family protein